MTLFMLVCLLLARANGLYVPPACWVVFGAQLALSLLVGAVRHD